MALGAWGFFTRHVATLLCLVRPFRRGALSRVGLLAGAPLAAEEVTPERLHEQVGRLLAA